MGLHDWVSSFTVYQANGSNAKPMAPTCAESSEHGTERMWRVCRPKREMGNVLSDNLRQRRTCYAVCHILYPVSAARTSIFRMDSNSTSYVQAETAGACGGRSGGPSLPVQRGQRRSLSSRPVTCRSFRFFELPT